jgi:tetratricopeptide (TPR) repeat protein
MMADSGYPDSAENRGDLPSLSAILQSVDHALAAGSEHAQGQLAELFAQRCERPADWTLLMSAVVRYRLPSLLSAALEATLHLEGVEPPFWEDCAKVVSEAVEPSAAEAAFRQAISLHPSEVGLVDAYGMLLLASGKPSSAEELYAAFLEQGASNGGVIELEPLLLHYSQALLRNDKNESALEVLLQLSIFSAGNNEVAFLMATAFKNLRDFEQAIDYYRQALPHHACPVDVVMDIGDCFHQLNRPDLAVVEYEQIGRAHV